MDACKETVDHFEQDPAVQLAILSLTAAGVSSCQNLPLLSHMKLGSVLLGIQAFDSGWCSVLRYSRDMVSWVV